MWNVDNAYLKCYCCGMQLLNNDREKHHFPIPSRDGGVATIDLCMTCHNHVDRIPLADFDIKTFFPTFADSNITTDRRLYRILSLKLWKLYNIAQQKGLEGNTDG